MSKTLAVLFPFCLAVLGGLPVHAEAPSEAPITLDGELTVEEWREGADQPVTGEGWARLAHRDDGLYLAVRTNFAGMVDVLVQRGDTLHQLHVSGQVGDALFERGDDGLWRLTRTYPWIGELQTREEFETKKAERIASLRHRLAGKMKKPAPPAAETSETSETTETPPASSPPTPPKPPALPPAPTAAEEAAISARHLEEHGWTGTLPNMGDSQAVDLFISSDFLHSGDRLFVTWQRRAADGSFETETFPKDAAPLPEGHSAAFVAAPFAQDFANWYVVE